MKVSQAVDFHLQYHLANSKKNTVKTCEFVLSRFAVQFGKRELASISAEEVLSFQLSLTKYNKQAIKRNRYSILASFYNFSINTGLFTNARMVLTHADARPPRNHAHFANRTSRALSPEMFCRQATCHRSV